MKTVVLGVSGGVDSSVAGILLKQQGYNVLGLFMKNWEGDDEDGTCTADIDLEDAKNVCEKIGIPFYSVNYAKEYNEKVFSYFKSEIKKGRTPNPDVLCNKEIKFGPFLEYAKKLGADYIATGHYCKKIEKDGQFYLAECKDENKDQTYFLNQINYKQLESVLFPLADITKPEIRAIAEEYGLVTARKKDSTGICFIGERNFKNFLSGYFKTKEGKIVTTTGKVVGKHEGVQFYTIGQGKGLNIGGVKGEKEGKWVVVKKDVNKNEIVIGQDDDPFLYSQKLICQKFNWVFNESNSQNAIADNLKRLDAKLNVKSNVIEFEAKCKIRYRQPSQDCNVMIKNGGVEINFKDKQRAITEGQFAVIYLNGLCLGGGAIDVIFN